MASAAPITGAPICAPFNPADWLSRFESLGGGYAFTGETARLMVIVPSHTDDQLATARQMIVALHPDELSQVRGFIRSKAGAGTATLAAVTTPSNYFAELDAIDTLNAQLSKGSHTQAEWDHWEEWSSRVWREIEALPPTAANVKLKARAIWSIADGNVSLINEGETVCCRMVRHVVSGLAEGGN